VSLSIIRTLEQYDIGFAGIVREAQMRELGIWR
jgi:hypothetical protein